jgi:hypothetical protein
MDNNDGLFFNYQIANLPNYQVEQSRSRRMKAGCSDIRESGDHEGSGISQEDL